MNVLKCLLCIKTFFFEITFVDIKKQQFAGAHLTLTFQRTTTRQSVSLCIKFRSFIRREITFLLTFYIHKALARYFIKHKHFFSNNTRHDQLTRPHCKQWKAQDKHIIFMAFLTGPTLHNW